MARLSDHLKRRIVIAVTSEQYGKELIDAIEHDIAGIDGGSGNTAVSSIEAGKVTLGAGGNATVLSTNVSSTSKIFLSESLQGLNGKLHYDTVVDGVSFNIHTGNGSDSGHVIDWMLVN